MTHAGGTLKQLINDHQGVVHGLLTNQHIHFHEHGSVQLILILLLRGKRASRFQLGTHIRKIPCIQVIFRQGQMQAVIHWLDRCLETS